MEAGVNDGKPEPTPQILHKLGSVSQLTDLYLTIRRMKGGEDERREGGKHTATEREIDK